MVWLRFIELDISGTLSLIFHSAVYRMHSNIAYFYPLFFFAFILRIAPRPVYRNTLFSSIFRNGDIIDRHTERDVKYIAVYPISQSYRDSLPPPPPSFRMFLTSQI